MLRYAMLILGCLASPLLLPRLSLRYPPCLFSYVRCLYMYAAELKRKKLCPQNIHVGFIYPDTIDLRMDRKTAHSSTSPVPGLRTVGCRRQLHLLLALHPQGARSPYSRRVEREAWSLVLVLLQGFRERLAQQALSLERRSSGRRSRPRIDCLAPNRRLKGSARGLGLGCR